MKEEDSFPICDKCAPESGSIFRYLNPAELEQLNYRKDFRKFRRGSVLYREGSRMSGIYRADSGVIKDYKIGLEDGEQIKN